jgi:hypothetical protein
MKSALVRIESTRVIKRNTLDQIVDLSKSTNILTGTNSCSMLGFFGAVSTIIVGATTF